MPKRRKSSGAAKRIKMGQMAREINYSNKNISKLRKEWMKLCSSIALNKLKDELLFTWRSFEKIIDSKDFIISLYMDEVQEHEDINASNSVNFQDKIEIFMEEFFIKLNDLHKDFEEKFSNLVRARLEDITKQTTAAANEEDLIKAVAYNLEVQNNFEENYNKTEAIGMMHEYATRSLEYINQMKQDSEEKLKEIWNKMNRCHDSFKHHTQKNKSIYEIMKKTDEANRKVLHKEFNKLHQLFRSVINQKHELKELQATIGQELEYLRSEKEYLHECSFALKNSLKKDKDYDTIKRTLITVEYIKASEYLQKKLRQGELMMKGLGAIRRYETIHEKIVPYPSRSKMKETISHLKLFWQRVAKIEASRFALNEERVFLLTENKKLQKEIHKRCQCLDCPSLPPIPRRVGKVFYIEGREMINKMMIQNKIKGENSSKNESQDNKNRGKSSGTAAAEKELSDLFDFSKFNCKVNILTEK